jgi:hypothetical protein
MSAPRLNRKCTVPGCEGKHLRRGHCQKHATQVDRHGRLAPEREWGRAPLPCEAPDCWRASRGRYCPKHARQIYVHGRLTPEREHVMGRAGCKIAGCTWPHRAGGYCVRHYNAARWVKIKATLARGPAVLAAAGGVA